MAPFAGGSNLKSEECRDPNPQSTAAMRATRLANSGLSLTTPSSRIVKSAGCNASDLMNSKHSSIDLRPFRLHHVEHKSRRAVAFVVHDTDHRIVALGDEPDLHLALKDRVGIIQDGVDGMRRRCDCPSAVEREDRGPSSRQSSGIG